VATYATRDDLAAYIAANTLATRRLARLDDEEVEAMLERAERAVDLLLGPAWVRTESGLRIDPSLLTDAQRAALTRATCAHSEWALIVGVGVELGDSVETPIGLATTQPVMRQPPKMLAELAGFGLLKRSATVAPDPAEPPPGTPWWLLDERAPAEA
jgi:hypothetical protein